MSVLLFSLRNLKLHVATLTCKKFQYVCLKKILGNLSWLYSNVTCCSKGVPEKGGREWLLEFFVSLYDIYFRTSEF